MTHDAKPLEKLVPTLLQSVDPQQIADLEVRQTDLCVAESYRATKLKDQTIRRRKPKATG